MEKSFLRKRMRGYAALKNTRPTCYKKIITEEEEEDTVEFEVVLGTLKKVELKSGVQLTIIIFLLTVTLAGFLKPEKDPFSELYVIIAASLLPPLLLSISGTRQIDQYHFIKHSSRSEIRKLLFQDLQEDLLIKERAFRGSRNISRFIVAAIVLVIVAESLDETVLFCISAATGKFDS